MHPAGDLPIDVSRGVPNLGRVRTPHRLPDLSDLHQTNLLALAVAQQLENHRYEAPTDFPLVTVARLLDKALRDYEWARKSFGEHDTMWEGVGPAIRPRDRGITVPLFRAIAVSYTHLTLPTKRIV